MSSAAAPASPREHGVDGDGGLGMAAPVGSSAVASVASRGLGVAAPVGSSAVELRGE